MATRARIGLITKNNKLAQTIEVAYEGYPDYTGDILKKAFKTSEQVRALLAKGNIEQLEEELDLIEVAKGDIKAQDHRHFGSLVDLATQREADYSYFFMEADKHWVMVDGFDLATTTL